jgi:hypothetical protein
MGYPFNNFVLQNAFLNLGKLEYDWNKTRQVPLCIDADGLAILQTVEGYVNDVLIQK